MKAPAIIAPGVLKVFNQVGCPQQNLNPRPGYAGPVAVFQIRTILEEDLPKLPEFEQKLVNPSRFP